MPLSVVILAAGQGKRMKSELPKVLQPLAGQPLLQHVINTARELNPAHIYVVYGHGGVQVQQAFAHEDVEWVLQAEQLGIKKVDGGPQGGRIEFAADTPVDPLSLIKLIQGQPNRYKFEGATLFKFMVPMERAEERFNTLEALFERLTPKTA